MVQPLFSVILVTHQRIDFLQRAVDCVLRQSFQNLELLVYNDAPEDNALINQIIEAKGDERIRFTPSSQNRGANYWRNMGVRNARGKYIAFLDDDDVWMETKLQKHFQAHEDHDAVMVYSNYFMSWPDQNRPDRFEENARIVPNLINAIADGEFSISTTSSVSIKNDFSGSVFDESLPSFQDWDAWFSILLKRPGARLHRIEEPLIYFTQHSKARVSKNTAKREAALRQLKRKYESIGLDISGFVNKQKLNLLILQLQHRRASKTESLIRFLAAFVRQPQQLSYLYTYKRVGRFIFKNH